MTRSLSRVIILALLGTAALLAMLIFTETGLRWSIHLLQARLPGQLTADVSGRLAGPLVVAGLSYRNEAVAIRADRIVLDWQPVRLLAGSIHVTDLEIEGLEIIVAEPGDRKDGGIGTIALPLPVRMDHLAVRRMVLGIGGREPVLIDTLSFSGTAHDTGMDVAALRVDGPSFNLDVDGRFPLSETGSMQINARARAVLEGREFEAEGAVTGTPRVMEADVVVMRPLALRIQARIDATGAVLQWQGTAQAEPFSLDALLPAARALRFPTAEINARGSGMDMEVDGRFNLEDDEFGRWVATLNARRHDAQWEIPHFLLEAAAGGARIEGRASYKPDTTALGTYLLEARWKKLGWPLKGAPHTRSPQGKLIVSGSVENFRFEVEGELQPPNVPPLTLQAKGQGNRDELRLEMLQGKWLEGQWTGSGLLAWQPAARWELAVSAQAADPSGLRPELAGALDATIRGAGILSADYGLDIEFERLAGTIRGLPIEGSARMGFHRGAVEIHDLALRSGTAVLHGNARLGAAWAVDWQLDAADLSAFVPDLEGSLRTGGNAQGPRDSIHTRFDLHAEGLSYQQHHVDRLQVSADLDFDPDGPWQAEIEAQGASVADIDLGRVSAGIEGVRTRHALVLRIDSDDHRFEQRLLGSLADGRWRATAQNGRMEQARLGIWDQQDSAVLTVLSDGVLTLENYCLAQAPATICLQGTRRVDASADGILSWRGVDLARLWALVPLDTIDVSGMTEGSIVAAYGAGRLREATLQFTARDGAARYLVPTQSALHVLRYQQASLTAVTDGAQGLRAELDITFNAAEKLAANIQLPGWNIETPQLAPEQPLAGSLELRLKDLSAISLFLPDVYPGDGGLEANMTVAGSVSAPLVDGDMHVDISSLALVRLGTRLDALRVDAGVRQNRLSLKGAARMGTEMLNVDGSGTIQDLRRWEAAFRFTGENLEILRLPSAQVSASPAITVRITPEELTFAGILTVPRARLEPIAPEITTSVSSDVIIMGTEVSDEREHRYKVYGSLELILGDDVKLAGKGFDGRLAGRLVLLLGRDGSINGQGEIRFVEGRYRAYGQNLTIEQGRVLYAGGPIDNPAINVVASRLRGERNEIEVGVRVIGTAKKPEVQLFSSPTMDESDVLSYLILGRPMNQAREGDGLALYQAATSVALVGGEALAERIAERFDLVEISIEPGDVSTDTALVLGRSLSPRLYVRYIQGLMDNSSAVQLRYRLSDKWMIETESGTRTGAGGDILYIFEH